MPNFIVENHVIVRRIYHIVANSRTQALALSAQRDKPDAEEILDTENVRVAEFGDP